MSPPSGTTAVELESRYSTATAVTGTTAVEIDVSGRLAGTLVPFGIVVLGLTLVLLAAVFRSVVVPVAAALGYVLSVGAAFGVVAAVFEWGWAADLLRVPRVGPVVSFLPIVLMGVLFGLAMEYQVFLGARVREQLMRTRDARAAVTDGVAQAGPVAAAATIMVGVFAAFVPGGDPVLKPIALALTVGVAVDAFVVRLALVPAVLALAGARAWLLPRWLDHVLPSVDVEGEALRARLAAAERLAPHPERGVVARGLRLNGPAGVVFDGVDVTASRGQLCVLAGPAVINGG